MLWLFRIRSDITRSFVQLAAVETVLLLIGLKEECVGEVDEPRAEGEVLNAAVALGLTPWRLGDKLT